jgi:uncharacterized protein (TIGR03435 family)
MIRGLMLVAVIGLVAPVQAQRPGSVPNGPAFEVASVKPSPPMTPAGLIVRSGSAQPGGRWVSQNARFIDILRSVYPEYPLRGQIAGGPVWINSARFDITARADGDPPPEQIRAMARHLLADRFGLRVRTERRELPTYALVMAREDRRPGPRLRAVTVDCDALAAARARGEAAATKPNERPLCSARVTESPGMLHLVAGALPLPGLVNMIQGALREPILDRTGLTGRFDIDLDWAAESILGTTPGADDNSGQTIFVALPQQLGLKLEPRTEAMDVLVIDSVQMPTPD